MRRNWKKLICLILSSAMLFTMDTSAFASQGDISANQAQADEESISSKEMSGNGASGDAASEDKADEEETSRNEVSGDETVSEDTVSKDTADKEAADGCSADCIYTYMIEKGITVSIDEYKGDTYVCTDMPKNGELIFNSNNRLKVTCTSDISPDKAVKVYFDSDDSDHSWDINDSIAVLYEKGQSFLYSYNDEINYLRITYTAAHKISVNDSVSGDVTLRDGAGHEIHDGSKLSESDKVSVSVDGLKNMDYCIRLNFHDKKSRKHSGYISLHRARSGLLKQRFSDTYDDLGYWDDDTLDSIDIREAVSHNITISNDSGTDDFCFYDYENYYSKVQLSANKSITYSLPEGVIFYICNNKISDGSYDGQDRLFCIKNSASTDEKYYMYHVGNTNSCDDWSDTVGDADAVCTIGIADLYKFTVSSDSSKISCYFDSIAKRISGDEIISYQKANSKIRVYNRNRGFMCIFRGISSNGETIFTKSVMPFIYDECFTMPAQDITLQYSFEPLPKNTVTIVEKDKSSATRVSYSAHGINGNWFDTISSGDAVQQERLVRVRAEKLAANRKLIMTVNSTSGDSVVSGSKEGILLSRYAYSNFSMPDYPVTVNVTEKSNGYAAGKYMMSLADSTTSGTDIAYGFENGNYYTAGQEMKINVKKIAAGKKLMINISGKEKDSIASGSKNVIATGEPGNISGLAGHTGIITFDMPKTNVYAYVYEVSDETKGKNLDMSAEKTDLSSYTLKLACDAIEYTGAAMTPAATVSCSGNTLSPGQDYSLAYSDNVYAGTAWVYATGKGNYSGTLSASFNIAARSISGSDIDIVTPNLQYNAVTEKNKAKPVVTDCGVRLTEGIDYTLGNYKGYNADFSNAVSADATVEVTGINGYGGTRTVSYRIIKKVKNDTALKTFSGVTFSLPKKAVYTYEGRALTPSVNVTAKSGVTLPEEDKDFVVIYVNNVNAGKATVNIVGAGNYVGSRSLSFTIGKKDLSKSSVTVSLDGIKVSSSVLADQEYDGTNKPLPSISDNDTGKVLSDSDLRYSYSGNTKVTTANRHAKVTVIGKNNYKGKLEYTYAIKKAELSSGYTFTINDIEYTGKNTSVTEVIATDKNTGAAEVLKVGKAVTVKYSKAARSAVKDGYVVTVNSKGTANIAIPKDTVIKYNVVGCSLADCVILPIKMQKARLWKGKYQEIKPAVTVKINGVKLNSRAYSVSYSNNSMPGKASATITVNSNYSESGSFIAGSRQTVSFIIK